MPCTLPWTEVCCHHCRGWKQLSLCRGRVPATTSGDNVFHSQSCRVTSGRLFNWVRSNPTHVQIRLSHRDNVHSDQTAVLAFGHPASFWIFFPRCVNAKRHSAVSVGRVSRPEAKFCYALTSIDSQSECITELRPGTYTTCTTQYPWASITMVTGGLRGQWAWVTDTFQILVSDSQILSKTLLCNPEEQFTLCMWLGLKLKMRY